MNHIRVNKFIPGIAWFFVVLVLISLPGDEIPSANWLDNIYFDKWVHIGIFGLLALLFMWPVGFSSMNKKAKLQYFLWIAIATSLWGLTTEFIQKYLVIHRSFDLVDWAADSVGAAAACIYCWKKYISRSE